MAEAKTSTSQRPIVTMQRIGKSFGANRVLSDISFEVKAGETHALLGENGAGKSTLMKILMGAYRTDEGRILFDGEDVTALSLRERIDRGIAMIFQELSVLPNRSVAENLFILREPLAFGRRVDARKMLREARALIERYAFSLDASARVGDLAFAQRQMVEILKAISRGAKLLVMDEPTSSLTIHEEETLFRTIGQLKQNGIGIVYISHRMADVLQLSDRISIIKDGRLVGPLDPEKTSIEDIAALMSRPKVETPSPAAAAPANRKPATPAGTPALEVRDLATSRKLSGVSFSIGPGEIVGLAGLVGSGRSTLGKALFGVLPDVTGDIAVGNDPVQPGSVSRAIAAGIALVPEDRRLEGLVGGRSIEENLALPRLSDFSLAGPFGPMAKARITALFRQYRDDLSILCRGPLQKAQELSGGNQQKIVFAKWLAMKPKLLILDEPTSGVDINAKRDMRELVRRTAGEGVAVLLISSELEELLDLSDRILVMAQGRITRSIDRADDETKLRALLQAEAARQVSARAQGVAA
ncbi:sugar ABC transporter ATP-binding protein [Mesorhizobium sp. BR1-1-9]|uniref:sugar ABC transporter ATP-binding protein n=1 Tax=unclassified Mesorhizobium TaxID=325217 RepID=UPI00112BD461|nr:MULTISPECIES: sugar ABC transporter ATP-binding protein [unclassified Mesorhizobium]MBZ9809202.1 sugar ABC transporter ATP-binding protein [Mesorhizobium sp. ESP-6-2]MBZ9869868.1 sugar ABC transporter ATP-binding protein [Mesorhizobium sp. BR1-1-9]MBZ9942915.1 sugar ABC transporter ATP-binding protein [Mesorhizobium sp. BR1-1-13]TPM28850.1 sugar ABC transporter ATP-binding protein [Mesorhizobium sp. B2-2-2]